MVVSATRLKKRISEDKEFFTKAEEGLRAERKKLRVQGLSSSAIKRQLRSRLQKRLWTEWFKVFSAGFREKRRWATEQVETTTQRKRVDLFQEKTVIDPKTGRPELRKTPTQTDTTDTTDITDTTGTEWLEDTTVWADGLTLKQRVTQQVAGRQTREEALKSTREEEWRAGIIAQRKWFREEISRTQEDLANIRKWLEAEWGAISKIAASRIREARSQPLREVLSWLTKGLEVTSENLEELDTSIDAILEARTLDREDASNKLAQQIEASNLSDAEKSQLIAQLWVETEQAKRRDEIETFRQKEQIKADMEQADIDSLAKTWLTAWQALEASKITEAFDVKEDSIAGQAIGKLFKEGKTPAQIRQILWLAEDETGKIDDEQFTRQEKLRKEFESSATVKQYMEATQQFAWILSSLWAETWPWDMAAIFQFMKTLDPSSVVRESEFAAAAQTSGLLDRVLSLQLLKKVETWQILTPKQRQQFASIAKVLFENRKSAFDERAKRFIRLSKEAGANPRSVVLDFDNIPWFASDLTESDFSPVSQDSSDSDIINFINKSWNTFNKDSESSDISSFLDWDTDLINGETTSLTNISSIWLWTVTQEFWATSPLAIDNVKLANWSVWTPWIDIDGKIWDPVPATVSWTVKIIASNTGLWNRVIIIDDEWNEHFFNHLDWFDVEDWQTIKKWQQIGTIWNSWNVIAWPWWDGSHLDYRVKSSQWWIDPNKFLIS